MWCEAARAIIQPYILGLATPAAVVSDDHIQVAVSIQVAQSDCAAITSPKGRCGWVAGEIAIAVIKPDRLRLVSSIGNNSIQIAIQIKIA